MPLVYAQTPPKCGGQGTHFVCDNVSYLTWNYQKIVWKFRCPLPDVVFLINHLWETPLPVHSSLQATLSPSSVSGFFSTVC